MRYVVAVAETGGFTRAAEHHQVVQSALSHQIAKLERELGARLFDRTSRSVRLTPAGRAFLPAARQALEAADRARAEVAAATGEVRGRLAVGVIPTMAAVDLPDVLERYRARHPQVRVTVRTGGSDPMLVQVRERVLDAAFLGLAPGANPGGVHGTILARDEHVLITPPGHPEATAGPLTLADLADEPFLDFPAGTAGRVQSDQAFAAAGVRRDVVMEVTSGTLLADLVRRGMGVALLPSAYAAHHPDLPVRRVSGAPTRNEHLVWTAPSPSPATLAFLAVLGHAPG